MLADYNEVKSYLNQLRESGRTNMSGAGFYLQQEFDLPRHIASNLARAYLFRGLPEDEFYTIIGAKK